MNINFVYLDEFGSGYEYYAANGRDMQEFLRINGRYGHTENGYRDRDTNWDKWLLKQIKDYDYVVAISATTQTPIMEMKVKKLDLEKHVFYRQQEPSFNYNYPGEGRRLTTWVFAKAPKTLAPNVQ